MNAESELVEMTEQDINDAAGDLLTLFEVYSEEDGDGARLVSEEGLTNMSAYYGTVPEEARGMVFLAFLANLYDEGHIYNVKQFTEMDEVNEPTDGELG